MSPALHDLRDAADIKQLVDGFYARVRTDEVIGFVFNDIAQTDWEHHLPKMYAFWETVLFRTGGYQGSPLVPHARMAQHTQMGVPQFRRWLELFRATVDELFAGPNAEHIKNCASDMADVIHRKINQLPATAREVTAAASTA
jgi:hemoglobin